MSDEVPEGHVPRDAAFWRTYHAVEAELAEVRERGERAACAHDETTWSRGEPMRCTSCGAEHDEVMAKWRAMGLRVVESDGTVQVSQP